MTHFPKKTLITLGLATSLLALPIVGIPGTLKAYLFFFCGLGVAGVSYVHSQGRKHKDIFRKMRRSGVFVHDTEVRSGVPPYPENSLNNSPSPVLPNTSSISPLSQSAPHSPHPPRSSRTPKARSHKTSFEKGPHTTEQGN